MSMLRGKESHQKSVASESGEPAKSVVVSMWLQNPGIQGITVIKQKTKLVDQTGNIYDLLKIMRLKTGTHPVGQRMNIVYKEKQERLEQ